MGSIYRRPDGKWVAQLSIGTRGNRSYRRRITRTKGEAIERLDELRGERRAGLDRTKLSLGNYLRSWLDESAKPSISANTYRGYEDVLGHLTSIADIPLSRLTAEDIERACNAMTARRGNTTRPASPKTIRNAQLMLRRALGQAEERGHMARNVARQVPLRKVPRAHQEAISPQRARAILAAVAGDRYEAAFALAFMGLREGEILGLAWSDLDIDGGVAEIRYQLTGSGRNARRVELKTAMSAAPVPLPAFATERLRGHWRRQLEERAAAGRPTAIGLVFVTTTGWPVNGSWLTKHFQALLAEAGLPRMRLHDLRHAAATLLVASGAHPRVAQELLRHASSKTTMEIYTHVSAAQQREAVDLLERAIGGPAR
jgi:integrase